MNTENGIKEEVPTSRRESAQRKRSFWLKPSKK